MKHIYLTLSRQILLLLGLLAVCWQHAQAQIKVGASTGVTNQGAAFEVEAGPYPGNVYKGFLPPRVALTDYGTWSLTGTPTDGMLVFNTATTTGTYPVTPGIYCWYNYQWNRQSPEIVTKVAQITSVDCLPDAALIGVFDYGLDLTASYPYLKQAKQISIVPATSGTYSFYTSSASGYSFSGSGTFTPAQVGTAQIVNLKPQGPISPVPRSPDSFTLVSPVNNYVPYCTFTITPTSAADCGGALTGTYKVNTPFDASNTKQITFTPPLAGEYRFDASITPPRSVNPDFAFRQTVTFSAGQVGTPQPVTLIASGTPRSSGTYKPYITVTGPYYGTTYPFTGIYYTGVCPFDIPVAP
jgi:hypothetical protein